MRIAADVFLAVLNSLWQAAAVAALAWISLRFVKSINAATRYAIWWTALGIIVVLPAAPQIAATTARWWRARNPVPRAADKAAAPVRVIVPLAEDAPAMVTLRPQKQTRWPLWAGGLWLALCAFRLWQIGRSYFYLRAVKRRAHPASEELPPLARPARLLISPDVSSPMAVGFLHPAVILPEGFSEELAAPELEHVLLHETAHIARWDDWGNLLSKLAGAVLALHPVAWWILREIGREREIACDDWVVDRIGAARPYAESLARMAELISIRRQAVSRGQNMPGEALAAGILGGGSRFGARIRLLLQGARSLSPGISRTRVAALGIALSVGAMCESLAPRWIAFAQEPLRFDAASIRAIQDAEGFHPTVLNMGQGKISADFATLRQLVGMAYGIQRVRVQGGPSWTDSDSDRFRVVAKTDKANASAEELRQMTQSLLKERFQLAVHRENRLLSGYTLVVGKNGSKLKTFQDQETPGAEPGEGEGVVLNFRGFPIRGLVNYLANALDQPVEDATGLTGLYDFRLQHALNGDSRPSSAPSIFAAVEDQLGLKLEPGKVQEDVLVIDHAERPKDGDN